MNTKMLSIEEIIKLLSALIGSTEPQADSALDYKIDENVKKVVDVANWCLVTLYETAKHRKSPYGSARDIGERAYAAILEYEDWTAEVEDELA